MIPGSLATTTIRKTRGLHWHNSSADRIEQSMWLDGSSQYLTRTPSAGTTTRWIVSCWVQRNKVNTVAGQTILSAGTALGNLTWIRFNDQDRLDFAVYQSSPTARKTSSAKYRDVGWYHICVSFDSGSGIAAGDRIRLFVNGIEVTDLSDNTDTPSGETTAFNDNVTHQIGRYSYNGSEYIPAYLTQFTMLENKSFQNGDLSISDLLDSFTFGTNGSQYVPKADADIAALATTAGGNSFCLDFADTSAFGNDISSNNNDFSDAGSPTAANQSRNSPSLQYPIINPLTKVGSAASTLSEGNTKATVNDNGGIVISDPLPSTGLWYFEIDATTVAQFYPGIGQQSALGFNSVSAWNNTTAETHVWLVDDASGRFNNNGTLSTYVGSASSTGRYAVAWDGDNRALYFGSISGSTITWVFSGDPTSGASKTGAAPGNWPTTGTDPLYFIVIGGGTSVMKFYFEEDDWTGVTNRPADAVELNTKNFAGPDYQGIDYFDATLYEGNGTGQRVGDFVPFTDTFTVSKSAMFDDGDRRYLARTYSAGDTARSSNSQATISFWIKYCRSVGSGDQHIFSTANAAQTQRFMIYRNEQSAEDHFIINMNPGPKMFKAPVQSALLSEQEWSNVVINVDLDNSTGADKVKMFVNGVQITSVDTTYQSASNSNYFLFANEDHFIGNLAPASAGYTAFCLSSYLAELHVLDGQLKPPTDFGQVDTSTNRWIPKDYKTNVGTYGNRGFYMEFLNPTGTGNGVGTDSSGNGFNFTESFVSGGSAWATTDQFTDTPSKNFAVWDGGRKDGNTLSEGNLKVTGDAGADFDSVLGTMFVSSGKYYWEIERDSDTGGSDRFRAGVALTSYPTTTSMDGRTDAWGISENGQRLGGGSSLTTYGDATTTGDFIGVALDMDRNAIYFSKNGTWMNSASASGIADGTDYSKAAFSNVIGSVTPFLQTYDAQVATLRTASGRWEGTAPTGFLELNQDNLDDTASKITALAWIKNRDAADNHILVDRVRGVGKDMHSNDTAAEVTNLNTVQRFLQRGVQVGNDVEVNTANESYVLWQWLLGDSATTGSTNNSGSIASTVIAADAGHFSICTYTGTGANATIGHGLSGAPELVIVKNTNDNRAWRVLETVVNGGTHYLTLNTTAASTAGSTFWNDSNPTASVINLGSDTDTNDSGDTMVAISFRSVPGVCKVGSYVGNLNADGPYIDLGFTPRFFLVKVTDGVNNWGIFDTARNTFNASNRTLNANGTDVEDTTYPLDILSSGIKIRGAFQFFNDTGKTYIYLAMAEIGGNAAYPPIYGR